MLADIGVQPGGVPIFFQLVNSRNEQSLVVDGDPPGGAYFSIVDQTANARAQDTQRRRFARLAGRHSRAWARANCLAARRHTSE